MLKVSSPQDSADDMGAMDGIGGAMPPMPSPMGNDMPMNEPMDMGDEGMDSPMDGGGQSFDHNFDAGIDTDEDEDPKKYIQQLTGKLSQSLNKYNDSLPEADNELCKYVASMIIKASVKNADEKTVKEIYKKLKDDAGSADEDSEEPDTVEDGETPDENDMPMESKKYVNNLVSEVCREVLKQKSDIETMVNDKSYKKKPFMSPNIKRK